uniref:Uncharacterized protein n=1 Tax=Ditylenchus dipsaci TaxID=166011 RepID=A0A915D683_9BILA
MTKSTSLLNRLIEISSHYVMVSKVVQALQRHVLEFLDPQLQWKWVRSSPTYSILSVVQINRGFENLGKLSMYIRIMTDEVVVITKEFQQMKCGRDMKLVRNAIMLLTSNFMLNSLAILSKHYAWQILHANNNAFGESGAPSPTFYACNQSATKALFVQFPTDGKTPIVCMKLLDSQSTVEACAPNDLLPKNEEDMEYTQNNASQDTTNGFKKLIMKVCLNQKLLS